MPRKAKPQTFGRRLKTLREAAGVTQAALAAAAGVSLDTIQNIESDRNPDPRWSNVIRLAKGLGVPIDRFAGPSTR